MKSGHIGNRKMLRMEGQALTEFVVLAAALIPLFLLMPVIAKYQDIAHATQMASRYVAFAGIARNDSISSWTPVAELANDVRRRFFSNPDAAVKANDVPGNFDANQNMFWRDPTDKSLIKDFNNDIKVSFGFGNGTDHSNGFSGTKDDFGLADLEKKLNLQARGIYTANVSVSLVNLPEGLKFYEPFDQINLAMTRSTSLVIDPWTAKDPAQVESKIANSPEFFPVANLENVNSILGTAVSVIDWGQVDPPKIGKLDFWRDVVPKDRLKSPN